MQDGTPIKTANMDVAGIGDRIVAFGKEMVLSQSAKSNSNLVEADRVRWDTYLTRLDAIVERFKIPPLDLPRTHPDNYTANGFPVEWEGDVENNTVKDVVRRVQAAHNELVESASKDQASGVQDHDATRLLALTANCRSVLEVTEPALDMPEQTNDVVAGGKK